MGFKDFVTAPRFAGVVVKNGEIRHGREGGPLAGAHVTVDAAGEIDKRITATRLVLTGPFALAFRKKKDRRELYMMVEGDGFAFVVDVDPKQGAEARSFAAKVNAMASKAAAEPPGSAAGSDAAEQLRKLADLRDAGVVSNDEFEAKKAEILGRM